MNFLRQYRIRLGFVLATGLILAGIAIVRSELFLSAKKLAETPKIVGYFGVCVNRG